MIVRIREEAEVELEAAFDYYHARSEDLGHRFLDDYVHGTRVIAETPQRWPCSRRRAGTKISTRPFSVFTRLSGF